MEAMEIEVEQLADACASTGAVDVVAGLLTDETVQIAARSRNDVPGIKEAKFEAGSVTKTFVAFLLARLVLDGRVSLDERLGSVVHVEKEELGSITLGELASHSSGLPRLPPNLRGVDYDPANPYLSFGPDRLADALNATELHPKQFLYSNFGYGLLGAVLSRILGQPLRSALADLVFEPLGLSNSRLSVGSSPHQAEVVGNDAAGNPTSHWDFTEETAGCGALRTTIQDLLRYGAVMWDEEHANEAELLLAPRVDAGDGRWIGLAWWLRDTVVWHTGGTGGFGALLGFSPESRRAVAILTSSPHQVWRHLDQSALAYLVA